MARERKHRRRARGARHELEDVVASLDDGDIVEGWDERSDDADDYYDDDEHEERDPILRPLLVVVALLVIAILAVVAAGVYRSTLRLQGPRTAVERTLQQAEAAASRAPNDFDTLVDLASAQVAAGKYRDAEETLDRAGELGPDRLPVLLVRGDLEYARGDIGGALDFYVKALELAEVVPASVEAEYLAAGVRLPDPYYQPGTNDAAYAAAEIHTERGEWAEAIGYLEYAVDADPRDASAWSFLGDAYAEMGRADDARGAYEEALRFVPDYPPALDGLEQLGSQ